jgi:hypothetical protein
LIKENQAVSTNDSEEYSKGFRTFGAIVGIIIGLAMGSFIAQGFGSFIGLLIGGSIGYAAPWLGLIIIVIVVIISSA